MIGVNDIKKHRWFASMRWKDLYEKKIKPFYIPKVNHASDISNFDDYPDSNMIVTEIKPSNDPFLAW